LLLFSALAMADLSVLATTRAPLRGTTASTPAPAAAGSPGSAARPRASSARTSDVFGDCENFHKLFGLRLGRVRAVLLERARQRKFAQPVADHVFRHEHRVENLAVVDGERQPTKSGVIIERRDQVLIGVF
jgi:hypothetical protein